MLKHYHSIMPVNKWTARINPQALSNIPKRLSKIAKALGNNIDGTLVSYKVYMTSAISNKERAMANGCVRVYRPDGSDDR